MAKGSVIIGKVRGSAGNLTFSVLNGQQIVKSKQGSRPAGSLPTYNQAWQQMKFKWASLMSQLTLELCDHSFTKRKDTESSVNKFVSVNASNFNPINKSIVNVYDTSQEMALTMNRFQISNGDLNQIGLTFGADQTAWDVLPKNDAEYDCDDLVLQGFGTFPQSFFTGTNSKLKNLVKNETFLTQAAAWALDKGLAAGEMLTLVIILSDTGQAINWGNGNIDLRAGLSMGYMRFKLNEDGETFIVEASKQLLKQVYAIIPNSEDENTALAFQFQDSQQVAGLSLIHSQQLSGGWQADDSFVDIIEKNGDVYSVGAAYEWTQNASILTANNWGTQDTPILHPASLT